MFTFRALRGFAVRPATVARQVRLASSRAAATAGSSRDLVRVLSLVGGGVVGSLFLSSGHEVAHASGGSENLPWPHFPWPHEGLAATYDTASLRRGFEVYRNVCSTCHSLDYIAYRNLVGVTHTKEHAEAIARTIEVEDGPDDKGEMFKRPGMLTDRMPRPYPNDNFARYANNGALPPDMSLIVKARPAGEDYIFSLITGYRDPPAGIKPRQGQSYNPYFPGGLIAMPPPLTDGQVEFEDGTPATVSQMARDVSAFLAWCSEPESDDRKRWAFKFLPPIIAGVVFSAYYKRLKWNLIKTRRVYWLPFKH